MTPALRSTLSLLALFMAATVSSRAELTLVAKTDGKMPEVPVTMEMLPQLGQSDRSLRIQGDVVANGDFGVWAPPVFTILCSREEELRAHPAVVAKAFMDISYHVRSDYVPSGLNVCDGLWPGQPGGPALFLMAWVVNGRVTQVSEKPASMDGHLYARFSMDLGPDELAGQPVLYLWRDGYFVRPVPRFNDPAEQRAAMACVEDDVDALKRELNSGVKPNSTDAYRTTLLHYAVKSGAARCVELLLKSGADVNGNKQTDTPLTWAAYTGRDECLEALLARNPRLDEQRPDSVTALIAASTTGHINAVRRLLRTRASVNVRDGRQESAITAALDSGYGDIGRLLIGAYADFEFHSNQNEKAFVAQCRQGHIEVVRLYLEHKVSANASADGLSALGAASLRGSADLVQLLIDAKAKVNAYSSLGYTPLMIAVMTGNFPVVKTLLAAKADPSLRSKKGGSTAFHSAAGNDRVDMARALLDAGAKMDAKAADGLTPLEVALLAHAKDTALFLVGRGAKLDLKGKGATAAIESAIEMDLDAVIKQAISEGWKADSILGEGWPAVRIAEVCQAGTCERLLRAACGKNLPPAPYDIVPSGKLDAPLQVLQVGALNDPRDPLAKFPRETVDVTALVTPSGALAFPTIEQIPDPLLTQQVLVSLAKWRLTPPRAHAKQVGVRVSLPIEFPGSSERQFSAAQVDEMPRVIKQVRPDIPFQIQKLAHSGEVDVAFVVDVTGHPQNVRVVRASIPEWGTAVMEALEKWVFVPGKVAGHPVPVEIVEPFVLTFR